jgi:hypothetical protein
MRISRQLFKSLESRTDNFINPFRKCKTLYAKQQEFQNRDKAFKDMRREAFKNYQDVDIFIKEFMKDTKYSGIYLRD